MKFSDYIKEDMRPHRCYKCNKELKDSEGWYGLGTNSLICKECYDKCYIGGGNLMETQTLRLSQFREFCDKNKVSKFIFYNDEDDEASSGILYKLVFTEFGYIYNPNTLWFKNNKDSLTISYVKCITVDTKESIINITINRENGLKDILCYGFRV